MAAEDEDFLSIGGGDSEAEPAAAIAAGGAAAADESGDEGEDEEEEEDDEDAKDAEESASGEDEDDGAFDFDSIAESAVQAAEASQKRRRRHREYELSLDIGLSSDHLYLAPGLKGQKSFDTAAAPGVSRLDCADFEQGSEPSALSLPRRRGREVRGTEPRPVNDKTLRKKEAKNEREARLDKWFGLRRRTLTPELEAELRAIKLRANFDPKRFYKAHDSKELPKYFTIASEVGGGLAPVGLHTRTKEVHAHSGRSFLSEVLRNDKAQEWTRKRQLEVESRGQASFKSGHGTSRAKKAKATGTHRGGGWKKQKRG